MAETGNIGRVLKDSYRITGVLGEGGMGVVYRGEHLSLPRQVAIKTLLPKAIASSESRERFEREAAIAARLNHSGVTQVYDYGIDGELPFLIMELIEGPSLADVLEGEGPLPPARALAIARQLFAVLAEAHRLQLVHRDVGGRQVGVAEPQVDDVFASASLLDLERVDDGEDIRR